MSPRTADAAVLSRDNSSTAEDAHDMRAFFEMSLDLLVVAGLDGYLKRLSPSWTRTFGWTAAEMLARPSIEFVHPDDRELTLAGRGRLRAGEVMGPLVNRYLCKDGGFRWLEWRSVADLERGVVYAVARDVTEERLAEERLREATREREALQRQLIVADRLASVGTLAAGVAHEINNPLAYVTHNLALLEEQLDELTGMGALRAEATELRALASAAQMGAGRIAKIVGGLRTFSRVEEERREPIDPHRTIDLSIDMVLNEIRHRGRLVKRYGDVPLVEVDEARLGQVLINLLVNAAQALPAGDGASHEIRVTTSTDAQGRALIEVSDTGAGVPADVVDRIFEPFFTTKRGEGTGLGLSICHALVTSMGGDIAVVPGAERGATFRVTLPPATRAPEPVDEARCPPARGEPREDVRVLVVDDEPAICSVLERVLRGHHVTTVTSAAAALELLENGARFDVVLSDLMMPEMSGMELYAALERRFPDVRERVVFMSGGAFTADAREFLEKSANPRLDKPFSPQAVRELVGRFVAGREGACR